MTWFCTGFQGNDYRIGSASRNDLVEELKWFKSTAAHLLQYTQYTLADITAKVLYGVELFPHKGQEGAITIDDHP